MPKRSFDTQGLNADQLRVYYCNYSGKPAFVTGTGLSKPAKEFDARSDCKLEKLPRRKTDNATIVDTQRHVVKLYTIDGGVKLIRRRSGNVERQFRLNVDVLPVAYRWVTSSHFLMRFRG